MNRPGLILILSLAFVIVSCGRNYRIDKKYLGYIPYEENEILVFKSDQNRMDTIFLNGLRRFNGCYEPISFSSDDCEGYSIVCTRSDPNYDRYLKGKELVSFGAAPDGKTYISFDIKLRSSWFYSMESYSLNTFDNIPSISMTIGNKTYRDVKEFEPDEYGKQYSSRDHFVEKFYWSKSEGFLGLDTRTEQWRLIKKYVP